MLYDHFQKHIALNSLESIITVYNKALGKEVSKAQPNIRLFDNMGASSVIPSTVGTLEVDVLDQMLLNVDRIDLIKIDTEGHEFSILLGAKGTIQKYKPILILEIWTKEDNKKQYNKIKSFLAKIGYSRVDSIEDDFIFIHKDNINK